MRIRNKLITIILALAIIPMVFVSYCIFNTAKRNLEENTIAKLEAITETKADILEAFFAERKSDLIVLQHRNVLKTTFPVLDQFSRDQYNPSWIEAKKTLDYQLHILQAVYEYANIILLNKDGEVIYASSPEHGTTDLKKYMSGLDNADFLKADSGIYIGDVLKISCKEHPYIMVLAKALYDTEENKFMGSMCLAVDMGSIYKTICDNAGLGQSGETLLVKKTPDKKVLFLSPLKYDYEAILGKQVILGAKIAIPAQEAASGKTGSGISTDYLGNKILSVWRPIPSLGWGIVTKINAKEAFGQIEKLKKIVIVILIITVPLIILTALTTAKSISDPIHHLHKGTEIIGNGNLNYKVGTAVRDEIGQLSRSFDEMTGNLLTTTVSRDALNEEIAYRKKAEIESSKLAKEWSETFDAMSDAVSIQSEDFVILNANATFAKMFNKTKEEVIGRKCFELVHCKNAPIEGCPFKKAKLTKNNEYVETFEPTLGIWVAVSTSPVFDEQGNIKKVIHIMRDITARKLSERALKESEEKYKTLYESSHDAIMMILPSEKKFIGGNPAALKLFGCKDEKEFTSLTPADLSPKNQPDGTDSFLKSQEMMKTAMEKGGHFFEWVHKRKDGTEFNATVLLTGIELKGEKALQATVRDVTESKKAKKEMKEAVEMKSKFISTASHELRTPLTSIKEGVNLVYSETTGPLNNDQKEFLGIAKRNVDRLARLVNYYGFHP